MTKRNGLGFEINPEYESTIKERMHERVPDLFSFEGLELEENHLQQGKGKVNGTNEVSRT